MIFTTIELYNMTEEQLMELQLYYYKNHNSDKTWSDIIRIAVNKLYDEKTKKQV